MKYFTWKDLTTTTKNLDNTPNKAQKDNIEYLVDHLLDPVRDRLGIPIKITSCYRSPAVNQAVGGSSTSQHCANNGAAADLKCENNFLLFKTIETGYEFDQLIWEYGTDASPDWVHVSLKKSGNRKDVRRKYKNNPNYLIFDD